MGQDNRDRSPIIFSIRTDPILEGEKTTDLEKITEYKEKKDFIKKRFAKLDKWTTTIS